MRGVAFLFYASSVLYVTAGMIFGIVMAASQDHSLAGAHAHLNLLGWVTMALSGIYYHIVPVAAESRLAKPHFAVATLGLWLMIPGIVLAVRDVTDIPAILGSLFTLLSMLIFAAVIFSSHKTK